MHPKGPREDVAQLPLFLLKFQKRHDRQPDPEENQNNSETLGIRELARFIDRKDPPIKPFHHPLIEPNRPVRPTQG